MVAESLLSLTLFSAPNDINPPHAPFDPVTAEVSQDDDGTVEILAFDADGGMVGALLIFADPTVGVRLDAKLADGYASMLIIPVDSEPRIDMLSHDELRQRCGGEPDPEAVTTWWDSNLADLCEAPERIDAMLAVAHDPMLEIGVNPVAHKPSRRECVWRFAMSTSVCVAAIASPIFAGGCAISTIMNLCSCAQHLGIENYCNWD